MKRRVSRRTFMQESALLTGAATTLPLLSSLGVARSAFGAPAESAPISAQASAGAAVGAHFLDASARPPAAQTTGFDMGTAISPGGHSIRVDSRSLLRDGAPWVPLSGEFHFSRCPASEWREELLKMKAGGVSIVTTYLFWIHHEEVEGRWDWNGQRDLRGFLEGCQEVDLNVLVRIGPWSHGEVRNGGFPDWLQQKGDAKEIELRRDDPGYLGYVATLYAQISQQMKGLLWKDGGPVIGVQLENEYSGPAQHLMTLKQMARAAGMDLPLYTCTGWGRSNATPYGEILPFSGAYTDGFWDRSLAAMPGGYSRVLRFSGARSGSASAMGAVGGVASAGGAASTSTGTYPFLTCELGAGMMSSYHRRIFSYPEDTESLALVKLGSGANLLGFYMYHGGVNPDGRLTDLNETQATGYWNDLPVKNYDFQAPIGAFGEERAHYHWLRQIGLFLQDFGSGLAGMTARMPAVRGPLNWAVRSDGRSGYVYVNNYERLSPQAKQENIQFQVNFADGEVRLPANPVTIPGDCRFFWPVNLDLGGVNLVHATAQPICHVDEGRTRYTVFKQTAGVPTEFVVDGRTARLVSSTGRASEEGDRIHVSEVQPGLGGSLRLAGKDGREHILLLLDEATALNLWKGQWRGRERLFLTQANLLMDGATLRLLVRDSEDCSIAILPAPQRLTDGGGTVAAEDDGLFRRFSPRRKPVAALRVTVEQLRSAGLARTIPIAPSIPARKQGMAMQPEAADFEQAAVWRVQLPPGVDPDRELLLRIRYTGDVLRAYLGERLIDDDFYNGRPFELGLHRFGPAAYRDGVVLKILPLREDAPIYLTERSGLHFSAAHTALTLDGIDVVETREVRLEG